jgi:hypothetical protein
MHKADCTGAWNGPGKRPGGRFSRFLPAPATWKGDGTIPFGPAASIPGVFGGRTAHATSDGALNRLVCPTVGEREREGGSHREEAGDAVELAAASLTARSAGSPAAAAPLPCSGASGVASCAPQPEGGRQEAPHREKRREGEELATVREAATAA